MNILTAVQNLRINLLIFLGLFKAPTSYKSFHRQNIYDIQGGSNMTGTDLCVNKPHCAEAVRP